MPPFFDSSPKQYGILLIPTCSPLSLMRTHLSLQCFINGYRNHQSFLFCFLHFLGLLPPTRSLSLCIFAALSVCCSVLFVDRIAPTQVKITYNFIATFASKLLAFSLSVLVLLFLRYPFSFYPSKANHCLVYGQSWFHKLRYNLGFVFFCSDFCFCFFFFLSNFKLL